MRDLQAIADRLVAELERKDQLREDAMVACRGILRASTGAVRTLHQGGDPSPALEEAIAAAGKLKADLAQHPDVYHEGFVNEALQELAEAGIVHAILTDKPLPGPEDLHCPAVPYALGLGDAVGELRRAALDAMRQARWQDAERMLGWMDALFDALMRIDQPVAGHVRRKQDVARGLIEKTRGDLTVTMRGRSLEASITDMLDELEQGRTPRRAKKAPAELDLDAESTYRGGKP